MARYGAYGTEERICEALQPRRARACSLIPQRRPVRPGAMSFLRVVASQPIAEGAKAGRPCPAKP
jgi:hypothetical protein